MTWLAAGIFSAVALLVAAWAFYPRSPPHLRSPEGERASRLTLLPPPPPRSLPQGDAAGGQPPIFREDDIVWPPEDHGSGNGQEAGPLRPEDLTPAEKATIDRALSEAEQASTGSLVAAVQGAMAKGGGRELYYHAFLLIWALDREPRRLEELHALLATDSTNADFKRTLLYIIGGVRSRESTELLLECLDEPWSGPFMKQLIIALNQTKWADREVIEDQYGQMIHSSLIHGPSGWPAKYDSFGETSTDPRVVDVMLAHALPGKPTEIRDLCASILEELGYPENARKVDPDTKQKLHDFYVNLARTETSEWALRAAATYLGQTPSAEVATIAWDRLSQQAPNSRDRAMTASAIASQAGSVDDVLRIVAAAPSEGELVRLTFLISLRTEAAKTPAERSQVSYALATWVMTDPSERVRLQALLNLSVLLPESAPDLEWAKTDASQAVRTRAEKILQDVPPRGALQPPR